MKAFRYERPGSTAAAAKASSGEDAALKSGGIDLLDRMKERLEEPSRVVDLSHAQDEGLREIRALPIGGVSIGALVTLARIAKSPEIRKAYPALADAAGRAASPQIRNRATVAGNVAQHTRCGYYRHESFPCLKRGDATCPVLDDGAVQDTAGIFGNETCASAHPSSVAPVLVALGAKAVVASATVPPRRLELGGLYQPPKQGVRDDLVLEPGAVIRALELPPVADSQSTGYEEVRQKAAFDWALVSCAVRVTLSGSKVDGASIVLGSVAPAPYRAAAAEAFLRGKTLSERDARQAGEEAAKGAQPLPGNRYKVDLVKVAVRRALLQAAGRTR